MHDNVIYSVKDAALLSEVNMLFSTCLVKFEAILQSAWNFAQLIV